MSVLLGGKTACQMKGGHMASLTPGEYAPASGSLMGGSRRRLRRTKGHARRARVRSSSAGGKKRGGSRKSKKSKKHGGSRKHKHSKRCHH